MPLGHLILHNNLFAMVEKIVDCILCFNFLTSYRNNNGHAPSLLAFNLQLPFCLLFTHTNTRTHLLFIALAYASECRNAYICLYVCTFVGPEGATDKG